MEFFYTTENTGHGFLFFVWAGARLVYRSARVYGSRIEAAMVAREIVAYAQA